MMRQNKYCETETSSLQARYISPAAKMASTYSQTVMKLLENATNPSVVNQLVSPTATYVSLNYTNENLTRVMPWCGTHNSAGPEAIISTFDRVGKYWTTMDFKVHAVFGEKEHVAVFGQFTYRSKVMDKAATSPFSVWCRFDSEGKICYMQFMEDTLATSETFKKAGRVIMLPIRKVAMSLLSEEIKLLVKPAISQTCYCANVTLIVCF
jgi:hypothetical protein